MRRRAVVGARLRTRPARRPAQGPPRLRAVVARSGQGRGSAAESPWTASAPTGTVTLDPLKSPPTGS